MSQFSLALEAASAATGLTQTALCEPTGISLSSMSKYFRDSAPIGAKVAARLISAFPAPHNAHLLAAYLRDQIPDGLDQLVTILPNTGLAEASPDPIPPRPELDGPARELLGYFGRRMKDPVIANLLESTRKVLES